MWLTRGLVCLLRAGVGSYLEEDDVRTESQLEIERYKYKIPIDENPICLMGAFGAKRTLGACNFSSMSLSTQHSPTI